MNQLSTNIPTVFIAYASEGGNAKSLAEDFAKRCQSLSLGVEVLSLNALTEQDFANSFVIYFVSTTGNGELPANGKLFKECLTDHCVLEQLNYALFALGSRSYSQFCGGGKALLASLQTKQACSVIPPVFAGDEFHSLYASWAISLLAKLSERDEHEVEAALDEFAQKPKANYQLINRQKLTSTEAQQATYHLVLEAESDMLSYSPGDVVSISPNNPLSRVKSMMDALHLSHDTQVIFNQQTFGLQDFLTTQVELSKIGSALIKKTGAILNDWGLLTKASNASELASLQAQYDAVSWFKSYPIPVEQQLDWLTALVVKTPRYYSIASDPEMVDNQLHLTVGLVQQSFKDSGESEERLPQQYGLGSGVLCQELDIGQSIELSLQVHPNFHLQLEAPMIWVATGTGIAPFIGFLMQLLQMFPGSRPKIILYFGVRHPEEDYLYQDFLESCRDQGVIDLRVVFSRAQQEKQYVQHKMVEQIDEVSTLIRQNGHVYVCGSEPMWDEVEGVLQHAVASGCENLEQAKSHWNQFVEASLHKDVY